jgi:hypothetical protein
VISYLFTFPAASGADVPGSIEATGTELQSVPSRQSELNIPFSACAGLANCAERTRWRWSLRPSYAKPPWPTSQGGTCASSNCRAGRANRRKRSSINSTNAHIFSSIIKPPSAYANVHS